MYRITVRTRGKYDNVELGPRYCLTKKSALNLIDTFIDTGCEIGVEKFIRIHSDVFCWSTEDYDDKVFDHFWDRWSEVEEEC